MTDSADAPVAADQATEDKSAWQTPTLTDMGDAQALTGAGPGANADGGGFT